MSLNSTTKPDENQDNHLAFYVYLRSCQMVETIDPSTIKIKYKIIAALMIRIKPNYMR